MLSTIIEKVMEFFEKFNAFLAKLGISAEWDSILSGLIPSEE